MYLDQSVTFTETPKGSGLWSPVGLDDLLAMTGNRPAPATAGSAGGAGSGGGGGATQRNAGGSSSFGGLD